MAFTGQPWDNYLGTARNAILPANRMSSSMSNSPIKKVGCAMRFTGCEKSQEEVSLQLLRDKVHQLS